MLDLKYVAGLFDGEGYVYIFKKVRGNSTGYYLSAGITMCHRPILEILHQQFGGHLNGSRAELLNPNHRTQFLWGLANKQAASFIKEIQPYVIIKKDEIDIGLALQDHIEKIGYPTKEQRDGVIAYRENLFQQCKTMKSRTFEPMLKKRKGPFGRPPTVLRT